jgi:hypothetical protein
MDILKDLWIYAGAQEILAAPDYFDYAAFWWINRFFQRICVGAFYLHPVLNL